jgi:hypothetical protein
MGRNPNSFQKRQREFDKKRKAEDKRKRRQAQKVWNADHKSTVTLTATDVDDDWVSIAYVSADAAAPRENWA